MFSLKNERLKYINCSILVLMLIFPLVNFVLSFFTSAHSMIFNFVFLIISLMYLLPLFVLWLINSKNKREQFISIKKTPELIFFILFLLYLTVSTFFSINPYISFFGINEDGGLFEEGLVQFFTYACVFYFAYSLKEENLALRILKIFSFVSIIVAILTFVDPNGKIFPAFKDTIPYSAMFVNSNHYGYFLCMAILVNVGLYLFEKNIYQKIIFALSSVLLIIQLLFNTSFGPAIAVCITLILLPFAYRFFKQKWRYETFIPIIIFLLSAILIKNGKFYSDLSLTFNQLIGISQNSGNTSSYGTGRFGLWLHSLNLIIQNPIFGIGLGNFTMNGQHNRPHNEYLQYAVNGGILCALLYIAAILTMFIRAIKNRKSTSDLSFIVGGAIFCYLISAMFGNTMPHVMPFFATLLGLFVRSIKKVA